MTRLPRDVSGQDLVKALKTFGYILTRQVGSHMRLTTTEKGQHHVTIPNHNALRLGTLASILDDVSHHFQMSREELLQRLSIN